MLAFAWLSMGLLRDLVTAREEDRVVSAAVLADRPIRRSLGAAELVVALGLVDLVFLAFVVVQLRYLFGGHALVQSRAHLTYAQYARHGFFELAAVAVLVLPLLLGADGLFRRTRPSHERLFRLLAGVLLLLLAVVMASALQRMRLYEHEYGLTELRIYVTGVRDCVAARVLDLGHDVVSWVRLAAGSKVVDDHAHALASELECVRAPESPACTGHDCDLAVHPVEHEDLLHRELPDPRTA